MYQTAALLSTAAGRTQQDGIYLLRADGSDAGFTTGGHTWTGDSGPYKSCVRPDGHLYVSDLSNDLAFEFNDDMTAVTQLIDASNRTSLQSVGGLYVTGTGADRKLALVNSNYLDTLSKGIIQYDLGTNATVAPNDKRHHYRASELLQLYARATLPAVLMVIGNLLRTGQLLVRLPRLPRWSMEPIR